MLRSGTLTHLVLQNIDLRKDHDLDDIKAFLEKLEAENKITKLEKEAIRVQSIYRFIKSGLACRLRKAEIIEREKPFYINVTVRDVYGIDSDEKILVQGIIDLYFIDSDGRLILVDYKTDYVVKEEELINKYSVQLKLYKRALEESLDRKVDEVYIFSTYVGKEIRVE